MRRTTLSQNSYIALAVIFLVTVFAFLGAFTSIQLLSSNKSGPTASFSGLAQIDGEYSLLRCDQGEIYRMMAQGLVSCDADGVTVDVTGSAPTLISTVEAVNDTAGCFTVAGDTLTIDVACLAGVP